MQDVFVFELLIRGQVAPRKGYFLDSGAGHPCLYGSNTFALERQFGWTGLLMDINPAFRTISTSCRNSTYLTADLSSTTGDELRMILATLIENKWKLPGERDGMYVLDYWSFDLDQVGDRALSLFPFDTVAFKVITM